VDYFEWDALRTLKNEALEHICIEYAGIEKGGVRGEAQIQRRFRNHINYHDRDDELRLVRIDLLQCDVAFFNSSGGITGTSTYYLAQGRDTNFIFKLSKIRKSFFLVGEIYKDRWLAWFAKENIQLGQTNIEEHISEEDEIQENIEREVTQEQIQEEIQEEVEDEIQTRFRSTLKRTLQ